MENLKENKQKQIKDKNINDKIITNKDDIFLDLREIFNHFSNNSKYLSNKNYKLFLIESSLLDDLKITPEYSNFLFYSFSSAKNCISFQSFCKLIIKIACIKYPNKYKENQENAFSFLFEVHLNPLLKLYREIKKVDNNSDLIKDDFIFNNINVKLIIPKVVSRITKEIIENNYLLFLKLYQKYFCFENLKISNTQKSHLSKKAFCKVLIDFDILPKYINSERTENIFNIIMNNREYILNVMKNFINIDLCNNDGMHFTLFHFILGIYFTSIINIMIMNNDKNEPNNIWEIFINNNDSQAFKYLLTLFYNSPNIKIVMDEELEKMQINILNESILNDKNEIISSLNKTTETETNQLIEFNCKNKTFENEIKENLTYSEITPIILNKFKNQLISIYKYYSELFLETNFSVYMTQNGFINFIKDLNLLFTNEEIPRDYKKMPAHQKFLLQKKFINLLSFTAINTIFSKFSCIQINQKNKSINKKINFIGFLNIILILSNKIFNSKFNNISFDDKLFSFDGLINSPFQIKYANNFIITYLNPLYLNILPKLEEDNFSNDNLMRILKVEKIKYIVNKLIPLLIRIIKIYNDNKDYIEYSHYFKCLSDFNIFPDFVQRKKMIKIFINFIKDFDKIYLLQGNNKVVSEIKSCVYGIIYIGIFGEDSENLKHCEPEMKLFNFIYKIAQSQNLGKISILNIKNNLQKDFLNTLYEIHNYLLRDKAFKINENSKINY